MQENYTLVQKGFRILHEQMAGYIGRELSRTYRNGWWQEVLTALSDQQWDLPDSGDYGTLIDSLDIANCLRLIDRRWNEVFRAKLSIDYRTWSKELMGVRNRIAHAGQQDLDQSYTERALDTMALLSEGIADDPTLTEEIRKLYRIARYGNENGTAAAKVETQEAETQKERREKTSAGVLNRSFGKNLPSWRNVMQPHPDVAEGRYRAAEFAADLAQVSRGEGAYEYRDPVEFFNRTYVTEGMAGLLVQSLQRLSGQGGEPVIQLKTAFGGGKTHSLLALYHMVRGLAPESVPSLSGVLGRAGLKTFPRANVAVLVGTALDAVHRKKPANLPGYSVGTVWGEMAHQLVVSAGKPDLYEIIRESDRRGVSPGSESLKTLLNACGPCLILMDEMVAYAKKIYGKDGLPAGSYDNFITFIQEITEAARASENSIVVASIPESDIEIGGEAGKTALETIEHTFGRTNSAEKSDAETDREIGKAALKTIEHTLGRMESIWKPVAASEGFEIVRRRLFLDCANPAARTEVCNAFSQMYQENAADFPTECRELEYRKRLEACYPIHPEVFDRLYEDWATLERFQRTRGVLRLMAAVIHELWMANDAGAMIMPSSIPLDMPNVREELVRHLPETWNSIIDREVDGKNSVPYQKDMENHRYGQKLAARRVARTIMLGSAPTTRDQAVRGLEATRIRLGVVQPGENIADFNDALNTLHSSLSYLYSNANASRYWYDTRPTLRKMAEDRASQVLLSEADEQIEARVRKLRSEPPFAGRHACPASSADVPDEQAARLVILKPDSGYKRASEHNKAVLAAEEILNNRGASPRVYKNMLVFLAPDVDNLILLRTEVKNWIAWNSILSDKEDLNLDGNQIREAQNSIDRSSQTIDRRIKETYCWLLLPFIDLERDIRTVQWDAIHLGGGEEGVITKTAKKMVQMEQIITNWAPALLLMELDDLLWRENDDISVKNLWEQLCVRCYLPRLATFSVLEQAIVKGVASDEYFALAAAVSDEKYVDLRYHEDIPSVNLSDILVKINVALKQKVAEQGSTKTPVSGSDIHHTGRDAHDTEDFPVQGENDGGDAVTPVNRRFYMSTKLDATRANRDMGVYVSEIIQHLTELHGGRVELTLDVQAQIPDGIPASVVRTVSENCQTLKVHDFGFEA